MPEENDFSPEGNPHTSEPAWSSPEANSLSVEVGNAMPVRNTRHLPRLQAENPAELAESGPATSQLAEGMVFTGNAELRGAFSVSGGVQGNLAQAPGVQVAVIVTETGWVRGDIQAEKISVMGQTEGLLDAGQGQVSLHDSARVSGRVRYGRIQVNGADLNATLERVAAKTGSH